LAEEIYQQGLICVLFGLFCQSGAAPEGLESAHVRHQEVPFRGTLEQAFQDGAAAAARDNEGCKRKYCLSISIV